MANKRNLAAYSGWSIYFGALLVAASLAAETLPVSEASGVVRVGDHLLIVDDGQRGGYFRVALQNRKGPVIPLDSATLERIEMSNANLVTDLESIEILGDGRIVVLSERLRALFGPDGIVAGYDAPFAEFGKRGLEGLAVRRLPNGSSRVAVLWEGGYPEYQHVPLQLQRKVGRVPMQPMVLVHHLKPGEHGVLIGASGFTALDIPRPKGREPRAQRFRAPDLVWHRQPDDQWGFIALLSSSNSMGQRKYEYHWLQRFSRSGKRIGQPLDLDILAPPEWKGTNWEGLSWFEEGRSLITVNESHPHPEGVAFVVELPESWQYEPLEPAAPTHQVLTNTQYFLYGPEQKRLPAGELKAGTKVAMLEQKENYCLIRTEDDVIGYVLMDSLAPYETNRASTRP